jgi:sphingosine-1-phosphate phosphatase 1
LFFGNQGTPASSDYDSRETSESEGDRTDEKHYVIGSQFWFWLFRVGTALGEEIFYASMFPFWFWNIDGAVGRRVIVIWALSMYVGE